MRPFSLSLVIVAGYLTAASRFERVAYPRHIRPGARECLMERKIVRVERAQAPVRSAPTHANRLVMAPERFAEHSPFLFLAEDWFAPPAGFPTHPHRGMETVTLVLAGQMLHRDHTGGEGALNAGDVQWMTAGKGVMHSEMPGPQGVHSLQLWLNLPRAQKLSGARYQDQPASQAELVSGEGWEVRLYAGRHGGAERAHGSSYPMGLLTLRAEPGARLDLEIPADERAFLYVIEGSALAGAEGVPLLAGQLAWLDPSGEGPARDRFTVEASAPLRAVLYSGRPIEEPVVAYGPFVMNTMDEIRQAFDDYHSGAFL
jgi:redox-sensitive bicupin YhaK (pirin superfamily)